MSQLKQLIDQRDMINHKILEVEKGSKYAKEAFSLSENVFCELSKIIVGQRSLLEKVLIALVSGGHVLVEGAPGLAKTLALKTLARILGLSFSRIQFTPDLLPSDLVGTRIYNPKNGFETELGPIHNNLILADEINRAPAKTQSALLESMAENQVTIGHDSYKLEKPFFVMATMNPIENEGTYDLPEAQMDRFIFKVLVDYPTIEEEIRVVQKVSSNENPEVNVILNKDQIVELQKQAKDVYLPSNLQEYIVRIVDLTRRSNKWIQYGSSPRGSISLANASKSKALISGRTEVVKEDIDGLIHDCLRHRIILSHDAFIENKTPDQILTEILEEN